VVDNPSFIIDIENGISISGSEYLVAVIVI
jgi:hypothetical protein